MHDVHFSGAKINIDALYTWQISQSCFQFGGAVGAIQILKPKNIQPPWGLLPNGRFFKLGLIARALAGAFTILSCAFCHFKDLRCYLERV